MKTGDKVKFTSADDDQINWGSNDDPRPLLNTEDVYEIESVEVHSWHTKIYLKGIKGKFNSVSFKLVDPPDQTEFPPVEKQIGTREWIMDILEPHAVDGNINLTFKGMVELIRTKILPEYAQQFKSRPNSKQVTDEHAYSYLKSEYDHQVKHMIKIFGNKPSIFEQGVNALIAIVEGRINNPCQEQSESKGTAEEIFKEFMQTVHCYSCNTSDHTCTTYSLSKKDLLRLIDFSSHPRDQYDYPLATSSNQVTVPKVSDEAIKKWASEVEIETEDEFSGLDYLIMAAMAMRDGNINE